MRVASGVGTIQSYALTQNATINGCTRMTLSETGVGKSMRKITVCSACKRATCWWGIFYCDEYKTAGTVEMSIDKLRRLKLEHPSWWTRKSVEKHTGFGKGFNIVSDRGVKIKERKAR
jgi:hypothetical protein